MSEPAVASRLGTRAPDFELPDVETGQGVSLADFAGATALVVMFLCRHCPYVRHVQDALADLARRYQAEGVAFVGISSNDAKGYPEDAPDSLAEQKHEVGFPFPYLYDESQDVARAYGAACTPDFFVYDTDLALAYRGQMDSSRPGKGSPDGADLRAALDALLAGGRPDPLQQPPAGCSIKYRS